MVVIVDEVILVVVGIFEEGVGTVVVAVRIVVLAV